MKILLDKGNIELILYNDNYYYCRYDSAITTLLVGAIAVAAARNHFNHKTNHIINISNYVDSPLHPEHYELEYLKITIGDKFVKQYIRILSTGKIK